MPGGDRTGPSGFGPMTGRGVGYCAGYPVAGYQNSSFGRGAGMGYGFRRGGGGRGWRNMYHATGQPGWARYGGFAPGWGVGLASPQAALNAEEEAEALKNERDYLKQDLQDIESRLKTLQDKKSSDK